MISNVLVLKWCDSTNISFVLSLYLHKIYNHILCYPVGPSAGPRLYLHHHRIRYRCGFAQYILLSLIIKSFITSPCHWYYVYLLTLYYVMNVIICKQISVNHFQFICLLWGKHYILKLKTIYIFYILLELLLIIIWNFLIVYPSINNSRTVKIAVFNMLFLLL